MSAHVNAHLHSYVYHSIRKPGENINVIVRGILFPLADDISQQTSLMRKLQDVS